MTGPCGTGSHHDQERTACGNASYVRPQCLGVGVGCLGRHCGGNPNCALQCNAGIFEDPTLQQDGRPRLYSEASCLCAIMRGKAQTCMFKIV